MIKIAGIIDNDIVNGEGISVSLFLQGCPFHCKGCHNPETWDPNGGITINEEDLTQNILKKLIANNINRNLNILGGEPLDTKKKNNYLAWLINTVKSLYPETKICLWTGYTYEKLKSIDNKDLQYILNNINYLIDGPFKIEERDITLEWRGSRNQRVIDIKNTLKEGEVKLYN